MLHFLLRFALPVTQGGVNNRACRALPAPRRLAFALKHLDSPCLARISRSPGQSPKQTTRLWWVSRFATGGPASVRFALAWKGYRRFRDKIKGGKHKLEAKPERICVKMLNDLTPQQVLDALPDWTVSGEILGYAVLPEEKSENLRIALYIQTKSEHHPKSGPPRYALALYHLHPAVAEELAKGLARHLT